MVRVNFVLGRRKCHTIVYQKSAGFMNHGVLYRTTLPNLEVLTGAGHFDVIKTNGQCKYKNVFRDIFPGYLALKIGLLSKLNLKLKQEHTNHSKKDTRKINQKAARMYRPVLYTSYTTNRNNKRDALLFFTSYTTNRNNKRDALLFLMTL